MAGDCLCSDGEVASLSGCRLSDLKPEVSFRLERAVLPGWHHHPDILPAMEVASPGDSSESWGARALTLLNDFADAAARNSLFVEPFFAMAALRLYDGSRVSPTSPVLLIPNSSAPAVAGSPDFDAPDMKMQIAAAVCRLKVTVAKPQYSAEWRKVAAIEIFVTPAIHLWFRKEAPVPYHRLAPEVFSLSVDTSGELREHRVTDSRLPMAWLPQSPAPGKMLNTLLSATSFNKVCEIRAEKLETMTDDLSLTLNPTFSTLDTYTPVFSNGAVPSLGFGNLCAVSVASMQNGSRQVITAYQAGGSGMQISETSLPRWLFFPDPDAVEMTVTTTEGSYTFPLSRHPSLWGAYYLHLPDACDVDPDVAITATCLPADFEIPAGGSASSPGSGAAEDAVCTFITRPLKLGDGEARKVIAGVSLRGSYNPGSVAVKVEGSETLRDWHLLARVKGGEVHGVRLHPMRYFRVSVTTATPASLEALVVEVI